MTWYDIKFQGQTYIENLTGASEKTLTILGIHGYATEAEAKAHPQSMNWLQGALGGAQALAGVSGSATNIATPGGAVTGAGAATATATAANPLEYLRNIGAFFGRLGQAATWLRVVEVLLGLGLVTVGLAKFASGTAVGRAAARAGKAAAIL